MKKIFALLVTCLLSAVMLTPNVQAQAQFDYKTRQAVASDFNQWVAFAVSNTNFASGAATVTLENNLVTIPGSVTINPFVTNSTLVVDTGSVQETVTITAVSCTVQTACTFTATFGNAHAGRMQITSGSNGAQEALDYLANTGGQGSMIIQPLFSGGTAKITGLVRGSTGISVEDWRSGALIYYGWTGSAYASVLSVGATTVNFASANAGFPTQFADTGNPAAGTTGTNTTGVANQLWYTQLFIPHNLTITNVAVLCGGTCTTDKIAIGIWSTAGTLLAKTAATVGAGNTLSGANTWQKIALLVPLAVNGPGRVILGVVTSGATAGDIQTYPLAAGPVCAVASAQGTLATFTPVTTTTAASCPYAFID